MSLSAASKTMAKSSVNLRWITTHFATAMGIGILFVPQEIGPKTIGIYSFLTVVTICIPLSYLNHKTLSSLIISSGNGEGSVLTIKSLAGERASLAYSFLLFVSSFSICIINFIALISAISQSVSLEYAEIIRVAASIVISIIVYMLSSQGHEKIVSITKYISVPLSIVLIFLTLMLIPQWEWGTLSDSSGINFKDIITSIPIIIFAMNFSPCVSRYIETSMRDSKNNKVICNRNTSSTLIASCTAIAITVMFFSFSVSMALNDSILDSVGKNTNSISLIAKLMGGGVFNVIGLLIVVTASFGALMGTIIGVNDGLKYLSFSKRMTDRKIMLLVCGALAFIGIINPNIIDLIKIISGPLVVVVGMLFPAIVMLKSRNFKFIYFVAIAISLVTILSGYLT